MLARLVVLIQTLMLIALFFVAVPAALASKEEVDDGWSYESFVPGRAAHSRRYQGYHRGNGELVQFDETAAEWPGLPHRVTRRRRATTKTNHVQADAGHGASTRAVAHDGRVRLRRPRKANTTTLAGMSLSLAFRATINRSRLYMHCEMFQSIADQYGGIRASGTPGYMASVDYVLSKLMDAGYKVYTTDVIADYFDEVSPAKMEGPIDYTTLSNGPRMTYYTFPGSASGTVEAPVYPVNVVYNLESAADNSTSGCSMEDFVAFPAGSIALMSRGFCSAIVKVSNAVAAGARAIILTNEGNIGREEALAHRFHKNFPVPIIYGSSMLGMSILDRLEKGNLTLKITTDVIAEPRMNKNILAETDYGDESQVIMIGAHLDSVFEGPGIQDNTSGSSAALELALQFKKNGWDSKEILKNKIRFAWWASEEIGILGSTQYVEGLSEAELESIAMYLNMDMIGSSNFVRFVLDGDGSNSEFEPLPQPESPMAHIEATYRQYFDQVGLPIEENPFSDSYGFTDHTPFFDAGIPVSDLHTGIDFPKTEEQAAIFGGQAGEPWDPCYHQSCDTLDNVNFMVMEEMARAAAHALAIYGTKEGYLFR